MDFQDKYIQSPIKNRLNDIAITSKTNLDTEKNENVMGDTKNNYNTISNIPKSTKNAE